jgi:hypothetical protein
VLPDTEELVVRHHGLDAADLGIAGKPATTSDITGLLEAAKKAPAGS